MPHFMIVLIPYINISNLSWRIKCLFLRNMEPLNDPWTAVFVVGMNMFCRNLLELAC